jgi:hypothetical protein
LVDGSDVVVSGRVCGGVDGLKSDRGEPSECSLSASAVVGPFNPGGDRGSEFFSGSPAVALEHVLLGECLRPRPGMIETPSGDGMTTKRLVVD